MESNTQNEEEQKEKEKENQAQNDGKPEEQRVEKEEEKEEKNDKEEEKEKVEEKNKEKEEEKKEEKIEEKEEEKHEEKEDEKVEEKHEEKEEDKKGDEKEEDEKKEEEQEKKLKKEKKSKKEKKVKKGKNTEKKNLILSIDEENNVCVDCGKNNPTKVSINNGVIICDECALKHEELGHSISFIKDIDDDFDEYLLNYIVFGSNSKFKRFLVTEQVDPSLPIEKKYLTNACFYYRINLKKKVNGETLIIKKTYEDPNELVENYEDNYPEFEHYKIKSKVVHDGALKTKQDNKLNKLGGSLLSFGKKMYGGIKVGANYVVKKAEVPTKSLKMGAGFVGKQVGHAYDVIKKHVPKGIIKSNPKETEDINKEAPPNLEENQNNVMESGRPLQAGDEVKEQNVEAQKEENQNVAQQDEDNNEEKIDI